MTVRTPVADACISAGKHTAPPSMAGSHQVGRSSALESTSAGQGRLPARRSMSASAGSGDTFHACSRVGAGRATGSATPSIRPRGPIRTRQGLLADRPRGCDLLARRAHNGRGAYGPGGVARLDVCQDPRFAIRSLKRRSPAESRLSYPISRPSLYHRLHIWTASDEGVSIDV